jgi:hypothetical protein
MLSTLTVTPTKARMVTQDRTIASYNETFCEGNIVRQRYTADHFLILTTMHSERTGNVVVIAAQNLLTEDIINIHWSNFDNYVLEG